MMAFDLLGDIKALLTGITKEIYKDDMPDNPDEVIAIYASGGYDPVYCFGQQSPLFENPTIQVKVRNKTRAVVIDWLEKIDAILDGAADQVINNHRYLLITKQGDWQSLGKDDLGRTRYSVNYNIKVQK